MRDHDWLWEALIMIGLTIPVWIFLIWLINKVTA